MSRFESLPKFQSSVLFGSSNSRAIILSARWDETYGWIIASVWSFRTWMRRDGGERGRNVERFVGGLCNGARWIIIISQRIERILFRNQSPADVIVILIICGTRKKTFRTELCERSRGIYSTRKLDLPKIIGFRYARSSSWKKFVLNYWENSSLKLRSSYTLCNLF